MPSPALPYRDRKSTRLNSSHVEISYAVFCLKKKKNDLPRLTTSITVSALTQPPPFLHQLLAVHSYLLTRHLPALILFFFFNDTATTEIYTLSLHDALPI